MVGEDVGHFGTTVLLISLALVAALAANRLSARIRIPTPALFLLGAAIASDIWPALGDLSGRVDERLVTVALVVVLFDGGMGIGLTRLRSAAGAVLWIGVAGTVVTAGGMALAAHLIFGFGWQTALLLGTALAPTDPAVVFSVLSGREIAGRTGTILEGESGANDPVGIALLVSVAGATGGGLSALGGGLGEFALQMVIGVAIGVAGGLALRWLVVHTSLPNESLYPLRALAGAAVLYGAAAALGGSGFLAVFIGGILLGDADAPFKPEIARFSSAVASLGEIIAFTILGLTVSLSNVLTGQDLLIGLALAAILIVVVRPLLVGALMLPIKLRANERLFVLWAGLKGAVPILLGLFVLDADLPDSPRVYRVIFVVVLISVVVQGGSVPLVARLLKIRMQEEPPQPYAIGLRLRTAPDGLVRFTVTPNSPADGAEVGSLPMGRDGWLSLVSRDGSLLPLRSGTRLAAGDEILAQGDSAEGLRAFFHERPDE